MTNFLKNIKGNQSHNLKIWEGKITDIFNLKLIITFCLFKKWWFMIGLRFNGSVKSLILDLDEIIFKLIYWFK